MESVPRINRFLKFPLINLSTSPKSEYEGLVPDIPRAFSENPKDWLPATVLKDDEQLDSEKWRGVGISQSWDIYISVYTIYKQQNAMGDSEAAGFLQKWRLYFRSELLTWLGIPELNEGVNDKIICIYFYVYIHIYICTYYKWGIVHCHV